jgi:hypothetical protein
MDDQMLSAGYEMPRITDYGDLRELTAACAEGAGGDAFTGSHGGGETFGGIKFGTSNPAYGCKSNP